MARDRVTASAMSSSVFIQSMGFPPWVKGAKASVAKRALLDKLEENNMLEE